ncbi:hypothetical protein Fcan01_04366 [Folsomia candida]|uniref:Uncharacterized protein n=1 Tax=Folsomia candida TaxID=158441 RepID=A0A226ERV6_FOLCA|nr:hypothetical protein Fcan01_04366 [Folsomia candida]
MCLTGREEPEKLEPQELLGYPELDELPEQPRTTQQPRAAEEMIDEGDAHMILFLRKSKSNDSGLSAHRLSVGVRDRNSAMEAIDDTKYDDNEIKKLYTENETQKLKELFEERNTNDQRRSSTVAGCLTRDTHDLSFESRTGRECPL